jgi:hypothetical protein
MFGLISLKTHREKLDKIEHDYRIYRNEVDLRNTLTDEKRALVDKHKAEVDALKESARHAAISDKETIASLRIDVESKEAKRENIAEQLKYERDNRQTLIDAAVAKECGAMELKYAHDLHDALEKRADGMQTFSEGILDRILKTLEAMKPVEPKVYIMDKAGSVEAGKPKQENKQDKQS